MSLISGESCECVNSELELFETPATQTSIDQTRFETFHPLTSLDRGGPIEFKCLGADNEYIDLNEVFLYFQGRILTGAGGQITELDNGNVRDEAKVFPVNYPISSFFQNIEVQLNSKTINKLSNLNPYRGFMEVLLSFGYEAKKHQFVTSMFNKDNEDIEEFGTTIHAANCTNKGAKARFNRTKGSKKFECFGRLHSDIFNQDKLLLSRVTLGIKLTRADPKFALMALDENGSYSISFEKVVLYVSLKTIASHIRTAHEARLLETNAKYPLRQVEMKFFTKGANRSDLSEQNLSNGIQPRRVIFGMVETDAFNGNLHKNPFNFQHFNANRVALRKNGQNVPMEPMELDFDDAGHLIGYFNMMHGLNLWNKNLSNGIYPLKDFKDGYCIYCFDLTADGNNGSHFNLIQEGNLSLEIKLKTAHASSITIVCYFEYDNILEISSSRNIFLNE